jgi:hypothetical protein
MKNIELIRTIISANVDDRIILLRQKEVIQWLYGDLSFLPPIVSTNKTNDIKTRKVLEDDWGRQMTKLRRPDLKLDGQWTNKFGEHLCEELYMVLGKTVTKPDKREHFQPDSEIDVAILEAKAETYFTSGTAGEKILGTPFKYARIPRLYGKPLIIVCIGGAEKSCREDYGNLPGPLHCEEKKQIVDFYRAMGIEYIGATDILLSLISLTNNLQSELRLSETPDFSN